MCEYLVHARLDCKYGGNGVILCPIPSGKLNIAFNGYVVVSKLQIQCSSWGSFRGRGEYKFAFQF